MAKRATDNSVEAWIVEAFQCQPDLLPDIREEGLILSGRFHVCNGAERIASIPLEVTVNTKFPETEPKVRLLEKLFPFEIDRHIFSDGVCCVCVWEHWLVTADKRDLRSFLQGPVKEFFLSQLHFEQHSVWPFGEWSHGVDGLLAAYSAVLNSKADKDSVTTELDRIIRKNKVRQGVTPEIALQMRKRLASQSKSNYDLLLNDAQAAYDRMNVEGLVNVVDYRVSRRTSYLCGVVWQGSPVSMEFPTDWDLFQFSQLVQRY